MWKSAINHMIQRLSTFTVMQNDYVYMPSGSIEPSVNSGPGVMFLGFMAEETRVRLIQGLAQYYRVSGYKPARDMAAMAPKYLLTYYISRIIKHTHIQDLGCGIHGHRRFPQ